MDTQIPIVARLKDISHVYKKVRALTHISLELPAGQMVGLLGPDGVGKSTLLGLIAGARKLQHGQLRVLGGDMASSRHRRTIGPRIAYMPQGLGKNLYQELSIEENLDFFARLFAQDAVERKQRIKRLTKATGLHSFLTRPAGKLSGGMKQKLGLCCALIHDPDFLILDEPTTGVDPLSRRQFWELIETIRGERPHMSVLVSTAYMDEAERFEQLVAMSAGRILATGTPEELKKRTDTSTLEEAFIQLLPEGQSRKGGLLIPPLEKRAGKPAIVARDLTRRFGDFTAVDNVSFEIQQGEIFGFLGSNGCGKTTTMKMLTGLLPASSGEAFLFGQPIDAANLEIRRRVGFMTQSFSLYGELTVAQNLHLHARLFHLGSKKAEERIEMLCRRFGLRGVLDQLASDLPRGMRQRLSLAVAIIHEPEMLILDEPTSGVDPVARDEFWELLVELSRQEKVTIFISTHFMNEAERCDRISLMHAGKVLTCDEPQRIIEGRGAETLEQAFISHIEDAIIEPEKEAGEADKSLIDRPLPQADIVNNKKRTPRRFNPTRLLAYSSREMMEVLRDPVRMAFAFLGSAVLLIVIAYGVSTDVENLTFAALDLDQTPHSRAYIRNLAGSRYFSERPGLNGRDDIETRLKANELTLSIEIPPGFGRNLVKGGTPSVSAWIDGANTMRAGSVEGYVSGGHNSFLIDLAREAGQDLTASQNAVIEPRFRYNPSFESVYAIGPAAPGILLLLFPAILMAVSIAREKEIGTIINFYVTPTSRLEFLIGKQLPYIAIGTANFVILTLLVLFVLGVPFKGSFLALVVGAVLYVAASTGFGMMLSMLTSKQVTAVFATAILCMLPTTQFSGMIRPVSTLDATGQIIGSLWPTTYFMHLSVGAYTKGLGFADLQSDLYALAAFIPVFVLISALALRKQEA